MWFCISKNNNLQGHAYAVDLRTHVEEQGIEKQVLVIFLQTWAFTWDTQDIAMENKTHHQNTNAFRTKL
jgi:hypothetical protein